jgi:hypothetical protein
MATIRINGITADPQVDGAELRRLGRARGARRGPRYVLLQVDRPLDVAAKSRLRTAGLTILEYVPDETYLCRDDGGGDGRDLAAELPFARFAGAYVDDLKIAPSLRTADGRPTATLRELLATGWPQAGPSRAVAVVLHADVDPGPLRDQVAAAAGVQAESVRVASGKLIVHAAAAALAALAAIDEVRHVEPAEGGQPGG